MGSSGNGVEAGKRRAGEAAADLCVKSGMRVGMGTGSTAVWAIRRIASALSDGSLREILAVPTSSQSEFECFDAGIPTTSLADPRVAGRLDVVIDGADEVDAAGHVTKGGGAALVREKVCAYAADRVAIVVTREKHVEHLGLNFPIPIEVVPFALAPVRSHLLERGFEVMLRHGSGKMGPVVTDNGNYLLDVRLPQPANVVELERELESIPGVLGDGIFAARSFDVFTAEPDGSVTEPAS